MSADFEDFARAASRGRSDSVPAAAPLSRVAVLGGGPDARLLAALSLAAACEVTLFSAYGRELEMMRSSSGIALRGCSSDETTVSPLRLDIETGAISFLNQPSFSAFKAFSKERMA